MLLKTVSKILKKHQNELVVLGVSSLAIFGSVAKNESTIASDIDILVDFDSKKGLFAFITLKDFLENLLRIKVDLVTKKALHPALKTEILKEAKNVF